MWGWCFGNLCCCGCGEFVPADTCDDCCSCLPDQLCATFTPDDQEVEPTKDLLTRVSGCTWPGDSAIFNVEVVLNGTTCEWELTADDPSLNETYPTTGSDGIGCQDPEFPSISTTFGGDDGTFQISVVKQVEVPSDLESVCCGSLEDCLCENLCIDYIVNELEDVIFQDGEIAVWDGSIPGWVGEDTGNTFTLAEDASGQCVIQFGTDEADFTCPGSFSFSLQECDDRSDITQTIEGSCSECEDCPGTCTLPGTLWFHNSVSDSVQQETGSLPSGLGTECNNNGISYTFNVEDESGNVIEFDCTSDTALQLVASLTSCPDGRCIFGTLEAARTASSNCMDPDCPCGFRYDLEIQLISHCPLQIVMTGTNPTELIEFDESDNQTCLDGTCDGVLPSTVVITVTDVDPDA